MELTDTNLSSANTMKSLHLHRDYQQAQMSILPRGSTALHNSEEHI